MICPICARAADKTYRPFCSRRCADEDLRQWLTGGYVIKGDEPAQPDTDPRGAGSSQQQ